MVLPSYLQMFRWASQPVFIPFAAGAAIGISTVGGALFAGSTVLSFGVQVANVIDGDRSYSGGGVSFHVNGDNPPPDANNRPSTPETQVA